MRLIDADQFGVVSFQGKSEDFIEGVAFILDKIYDAPTVEERPHGEWVKDINMDKATVCSECGEEAWYKEYCGWVTKSNFCPNCGAKMGEGNDMSAEKSNMPEFEWICPCCGGKEYDANSLCLECGCRMISREVTKNEQTPD